MCWPGAISKQFTLELQKKFGRRIIVNCGNAGIDMKIQTNQRKILIAGIALIATMAVFPPWTYTFRYQSTYSEEPAGYSFIADPPSPKSTRRTDGVKIDIARLSVQVVAVLALMGIGLLVVSGEPRRDG